MNKPFNAILYIVLFIFLIAIGSVVIRDGANIVANIGQHIMHLFHRADLNPRNGRGFGCFIQLMIIAAFVGWSIKQFRRK